MPTRSHVKRKVKHDDNDFWTTLRTRKRREQERRRTGGEATAEPTPQCGVGVTCESPCVSSPRRRRATLHARPKILQKKSTSLEASPFTFIVGQEMAVNLRCRRSASPENNSVSGLVHAAHLCGSAHLCWGARFLAVDFHGITRLADFAVDQSIAVGHTWR